MDLTGRVNTGHGLARWQLKLFAVVVLLAAKLQQARSWTIASCSSHSPPRLPAGKSTFFPSPRPSARPSRRYRRVLPPLVCSAGSYGGFDERGDGQVFDLSVPQLLGNFASQVRQTFRGGKSKKATANEWRYLGRLVRRERAVLVCSVAALVLAAVCDVSVPHYSSRALNAVAFANDRKAFFLNLRGMAVFSMLGAVFTGLRGACFWLAGSHVVARVRYDLMSALLRQEIGFHDATETGALTSRLSSDTTKISNVVSFHVNIVVRQFLQALGGAAYLFVLCPPLALVAAVGLLSVGVITGLYGRLSRRLSKKVQAVLAEAGSVAEQNLSLIRVVRAHANEAQERRRYARKIEQSLGLQQTQSLAYGCARLTIGWTETALLCTVLLAGALMVFNGKMSGEQLTTFFFYTKFVVGASFDVGDQWAKIQEALGGGQEVFQLLERTPRVRQPSTKALVSPSEGPSQRAPALPINGEARGGCVGADGAVRRQALGHAKEKVLGEVHAHVRVPGSVHDHVHLGEAYGDRGRVDFCSVSFSYPTRPGVCVLKDFSLEIKPGERVAIVGASGGGKSTLLRLLCRFYDPDKGSIRLGGRDLSSYSYRELSQRVAWVTQEPQLFPLSVRENIAYGLEEGTCDMAHVMRAAKAANAHNFVCELPDGYNTLVGEGGGSLSGGQKQRVAIARALIRDPEVLLLDEPTSALDVESEQMVQEALDRAGEGRTVLLIAHRLSTIKKANRVIVVQHGRVMEAGSHVELLQMGGLYAGLYQQNKEVMI